MVTYITQQSSSMSNINYPRKLERAATIDSSMSAMTSHRKRLLSEQNDCHNSTTQLNNNDTYANKKIKRESLADDVNNNNSRHVLAFFSHSSFENTTQYSASPGDKQHRKLTHINSVPCLSSTPFSPVSPTALSTKNMLVYQQPSSIIDNNENEQEEKSNASMFLTSSQLTAYMTSTNNNNSNGKLLIIDCGLPFRHNDRRIQESFLLNINDKLSRKRLISRGLKTFLDQNQINRLNQSETIVLYDDSPSCSNCAIPYPISPIIQCILDQIKRHDSTKTIYVLGSSFEDFYQHYPTFCYTSLTTNHHHDDVPSPSPSLDIDSYQMSEILSGLYLGNAHDAKDMSLLNQNRIKSIINISTTIPCYYENENLFDYLHLPCNDSNQQNLLQYFDHTFEYIQKKLSENENILVHCQGGVSRSPSFIIGYLMKYHSKTFDQAYLLVKEKRKIINPNLNFLAQLTRYEQMKQ